MLRNQELDREHSEGHCHLKTAGLLDLSLRHFSNYDVMSLISRDSFFAFGTETSQCLESFLLSVQFNKPRS